MTFHLNKLKQFIPLFIIMATIASCHNYYKASSIRFNQPAKAVDSLQQKNRYFILRAGKNAYYMNDISISADRQTVTGICILTRNPGLFTHEKIEIWIKVLISPDVAVLNEVHFFVDAAESTSFGDYKLQLSKVQKIEVIQKDKGRTTGSYIVGALGYTVGALTVVAIIALATKSSCPFISAYTGNEFVLQGEIYGGAIYPQLTRDDYMPLRMQPTVDGKLMVKISNEFYEKDFTTLDLCVISH